MNCRQLEPRLTAYLAGELEEMTARAARGHLRVCEACRTVAEDHARVREALAGLGAERPDPPPAMWDAIQRQLGQAEIADGQRSPWSRAWLRVRPHLLPGSLALGACAAAALIIQLRAGDGEAGVRTAIVDHLATSRSELVAPAADDADGLAAADVDRPARVVPDRDASAELADEARRLEAMYRSTVAELLPVARAEAETWSAARGRAFKLELARREHATVRAAVGRDRDRAWHDLITFLESSALGERVAVAR